MNPRDKNHYQLAWTVCIFDDCDMRSEIKLKQGFFPRKIRNTPNDAPYEMADIKGWVITKKMPKEGGAKFEPIFRTEDWESTDDEPEAGALPRPKQMKMRNRKQLRRCI